MKNLLLTIILSLSAVLSAHAQIDFKDKMLGLFQAIAFQTNYDNIIPSLKRANFNLKSREKKGNGTELLTFEIAKNQDISVVYSENKELIYTKIISGSTVLLAVTCTADLKANNFVNFGEKKTLFERTVVVNYSKPDYPYQFAIWQIGHFMDGIYLFNPKFGALDKFESYNKEVALYGDPFNKVVPDLKSFEGANGKYGFMDKTGKELIAPTYDFASEFSEELSAVKLDKKYGFIDKTGKIIIPLKYDQAGSFSEGLALVKVGNKYGFIDQTLKIIIPLKYDYAAAFKNGIAEVRIADREFYIDKTAKEVKK